MATLASIVIGATLNLFDTEEMIFIWRTSKRDFFVLFIAFILTLLLGPEYGVLIAVCLNIFFMLLDQYRMKTRELGQMPFELSGALFDVIHPDIRANEEEEAEELQEMNPGTRVTPKSDAIFVIKDYFPEAFTHPHLLIIRPTDTLTYINVDNWVMHVVSNALERLPAQWNVENSSEVADLLQKKKEWELTRRLLLSSINGGTNRKRAGSDTNGYSSGAGSSGDGNDHTTLSKRQDKKKGQFQAPPSGKIRDGLEYENGENGKNGLDHQMRLSSTSSSSDNDDDYDGDDKGDKFDDDDDDDDDDDAIQGARNEKRLVNTSKDEEAVNPSSSTGNDGNDDENSSIEESFTAPYSMTGQPHKLQQISIVQNGKVRFAEKGELNEGDEEKVEEESNRKEIKAIAERTQKLQGFVIIDMIHMNSMDSIVVGRLRDLYKTLAVNNISLAIARPRPITLKYLIRGKFVSLIGQDFVVDSINTCVIRCNAVLRAAMRFQALKLIEAEEDEDRRLAEEADAKAATQPSGEEAV
jgi:hypothetical protein